MTVKELKTELESLPDNMEVILQKDAEGNGYSPLEGVDSEAVYIPESTWAGEVYSLELLRPYLGNTYPYGCSYDFSTL